MEENGHHNGWEWHATGPVIITPRRRVIRHRGPEILVRIALSALSGLVVSLVWILASGADTEAKAWSVVIGLSVVAAMTLFAGLIRSEVDKVRTEVADSEVQTLAAIETAVRSITAEIHSHAIRNESSAAGRRRRPGRGYESITNDPGELITEEFRYFMQGRESRDDERNDDPW